MDTMAPRLSPLERLIRFGMIGLLATAVHATVGIGLHSLAGASPLMANGIAFSVAVVIGFLGHSRVTFPDARADHAAFVRFAVTAVTGFALNQLIVWAVTERLGHPYWLSLGLAVAIVPAATFVALRLWAFRR